MAFERQNPFDFVPSTRELDLAESKQKRLQEISALKSQRILGSKYNPEPTENHTDNNIVDAFQSSVVQTVGSTADLGESLYNWGSKQLGFESDFKLSDNVDSWSEAETADKIAGYNPAEYDQKSKDLSAMIDRGDYLDAGFQGLSMTPETVARSAGPMIEMGLATLATGGVGTGAKVASTLGTWADKLYKVNKGLGRGAKVVSKLAPDINAGAVLYGAKQSNANADECAKNNGGVPCSEEKMYNDFLAQTVLAAAEFDIFKGIAKDMTKGQFVSQMKDIVKLVHGKSAKRVITEKIATTGAKITAAYGAEFGQEYAQTWQDILATKANTSKYGSEEDVLADSKNQTEALTGGFLGGGAAVGTKSITAIPGLAATTAGATAVGTVKTGVDYVKRKSVEGALKAMSKEEYDAIQAKYNSSDKIFKQMQEDAETAETELRGIKTVDDLNNVNQELIKEQRQQVIDEYNDGKLEVDHISDIKDDSMARKVRNKVISQLRSGIEKQRLTREADRAKDMTRTVMKNILPEDIDKQLTKAYTVTKDMAGNTLKSAVNINSSAVRGIYEDMTSPDAKKKAKDIQKRAEKLTLNQIDSLLELTGGDKQLELVLNNARTIKKKHLTSLGLNPDDIFSNIEEHSHINKASDRIDGSMMSKSDTVRLEKELLDSAHLTVIDSKIGSKIDKAIKAYSQSKYSDKEALKAMKNGYKGIKSKTYNKMKERTTKSIKEGTIISDLTNLVKGSASATSESKVGKKVLEKLSSLEENYNPVDVAEALSAIRERIIGEDGSTRDLGLDKIEEISAKAGESVSVRYKYFILPTATKKLLSEFVKGDMSKDAMSDEELKAYSDNKDVVDAYMNISTQEAENESKSEPTTKEDDTTFSDKVSDVIDSIGNTVGEMKEDVEARTKYMLLPKKIKDLLNPLIKREITIETMSEDAIKAYNEPKTKKIVDNYLAVIEKREIELQKKEEDEDNKFKNEAAKVKEEMSSFVGSKQNNNKLSKEEEQAKVKEMKGLRDRVIELDKINNKTEDEIAEMNNAQEQALKIADELNPEDDLSKSASVSNDDSTYTEVEDIPPETKNDVGYQDNLDALNQLKDALKMEGLTKEHKEAIEQHIEIIEDEIKVAKELYRKNKIKEGC